MAPTCECKRLWFTNRASTTDLAVVDRLTARHYVREVTLLNS